MGCGCNKDKIERISSTGTGIQIVPPAPSSPSTQIFRVLNNYKEILGEFNTLEEAKALSDTGPEKYISIINR